MKNEDKRNEKKMFAYLKNGDVFQYDNNLYMKMDPFYDTEDIEDFMKKFCPMNAYNLVSHDFVSISRDAEVRAIKATLVFE